MSKPSVSLQYDAAIHQFTIRVSNTDKVEYSLRYSAQKEQGSIEEAITGNGSADKTGNYSASHLAGTESNGAKTLHQVKNGVLELRAVDKGKLQTTVVKNFTISDKGVLKVVSETMESQQLSGQVQGASTTSATLADPAMQLTTPLPSPSPEVRKPVMIASPEPSPDPQAILSSQATSYLPFIGFVAVIIGVVIALSVWQRYRRNSQY